MSASPTSTAPTTGAPTRFRGARLLAYVPWQARDYLMDRGVPTALIGLLLGYVGLFATSTLGKMNATLAQMSPAEVARAGGAAAARASAVAKLTAVFLQAVLGNFVFIAALFAINGLVANDRKQGFYRFLFSKPLSPDRYYGQAFVVHWAGFLLIVTALGLIYHAVLGPVLTVRLYVGMSAVYLCYAGIGFLLSAAARWDWLSLVAFVAASNILWMLYGESTGPAAWLLRLFPPFARTSPVYAAAAGRAPLPWALLAWFGGYGVACFVAGLIVLRRRRLAIV